MTGKKPRPLVPKLRFPEFSENPPWSSVTLGEVFDERQEKGFTTLPLLSVTDQQGVVSQEETNRKNNSNPDKSRYLRVVPGDIAYNTMRMWEGRSALVGMEGLVSPAYTVCSPRDRVVSEFCAYYFKTRSLIAQFRKYSQGLVKDTLNLKYDNFARIPAGFPLPGEQQTIADCLGSLDDLIAAEGRKLEALRQHKQGLMQQLFPQPGETVPRLRFPEFADQQRWQDESLGRVVQLRSGGTPSKSNASFWNGSIPWVSGKDMKRLFLNDTEDHVTPVAVEAGAKPAQPGTVLMLTRGMTLLKDVPICVIRKPMCFNQDLRSLTPRSGLHNAFLPFLLLANKARLLRMVDIAGHGTGRLDTEKLKSMDVLVPCNSEQVRIAEFLASFEQLILSASERISTLKQHKQGLLQQLFPSAEVST